MTMSFLLNMGIFDCYVSLPNLPISSKNGQFWLLQKSSQFLESTAIIFLRSLPHVYGWNWVSLADNSSSLFVFLQSIKDPGNLPSGKLTWQWKKWTRNEDVFSYWTWWYSIAMLVYWKVPSLWHSTSTVKPHPLTRESTTFIPTIKATNCLL